MVSEKKIFLRFSHYKSMEANDPWGMANLDPRDLIVRIYVGDHVTLLHTKNISGGPLTWFQRRRFLFFMSMGANDPPGTWDMNNMDARDMVGRIYVGDHQTLLHTKSVSS